MTMMKMTMTMLLLLLLKREEEEKTLALSLRWVEETVAADLVLDTCLPCFLIGFRSRFRCIPSIWLYCTP